MYCKFSFHVIYLQLLIMYYNVVVLFSCICVQLVLTWLPGIRSILFGLVQGLLLSMTQCDFYRFDAYMHGS